MKRKNYLIPATAAAIILAWAECGRRGSKDQKQSTGEVQEKIEDVNDTSLEQGFEWHNGLRKDHFYSSIDDLSDTEREDVLAFEKLAREAPEYIGHQRGHILAHTILGTYKKNVDETVDPIVGLYNWLLTMPLRGLEEVSQEVSQYFPTGGQELTQMIRQTRTDLHKLNKVFGEIFKAHLGAQLAAQLETQIIERKMDPRNILWDYVSDNAPDISFERKGTLVEAIYRRMESVRIPFEEPPPPPWPNPGTIRMNQRQNSPQYDFSNTGSAPQQYSLKQYRLPGTQHKPRKG